MSDPHLQALLDRLVSQSDRIDASLTEIVQRLARIEERQTHAEKVEQRVAALEQRATALETKTAALELTDKHFDARLMRLVLIAAAIIGALGVGGQAAVKALLGGG